MTLQEFIVNPTDRKNHHPAYNSSLFVTEAPEYSTGEVLLGSTYRKLLLGMRDAEVNLDDIDGLPQQISPTWGGAEVWQDLVIRPGGLASPSPRKSPRRQLMPLVPQIARYACVIGARRSRWFPANLLLQVIGTGLGKSDGESLVRELAVSLQVDRSDDILARFTALSLESISPAPTPPPFASIDLNQPDLVSYRGHPPIAAKMTPAERFCRDLRSVLKLKGCLTRRQWTVLVEALLRLGLASHVLWACHANVQFWDLLLAVASGEPPPPEDAVANVIWSSHQAADSFLEIGRDAISRIRQLFQRYVAARFGINLLLHKLENEGVGWPEQKTLGYSPSSATLPVGSLAQLLAHISANESRLGTDLGSWLRSTCAQMLDRNSSLVKCTSGFTNNLLEFTRHSLGQIETRDPEQAAYDQAYLLPRPRKRQSPVVQPGPAMLILLVFACSEDQGNIPASLEDLRLHLACYGLNAPAGELLAGNMGTNMEKLGLVVDSPDAAGGRLLVKPF